MKKLNKPIFLNWTSEGSCVSTIVDRLIPISRAAVVVPLLEAKSELRQRGVNYRSAVYRDTIYEEAK